MPVADSFRVSNLKSVEHLTRDVSRVRHSREVWHNVRAQYSQLEVLNNKNDVVLVRIQAVESDEQIVTIST